MFSAVGGSSAKRGIVFVQELMVETVVNDLSGASLDFADVDEHSVTGSTRPLKIKICDVISTGSVTSVCFRANARGFRRWSR